MSNDGYYVVSIISDQLLAYRKTSILKFYYVLLVSSIIIMITYVLLNNPYVLLLILIVLCVYAVKLYIEINKYNYDKYEKIIGIEVNNKIIKIITESRTFIIHRKIFGLEI
ncbi:hypothetical protein BFU36_08480 [Sulfolobus sp. A20]|nr:hypothetical protein BFU36_08480 [Sulfolobus sp. A20]